MLRTWMGVLAAGAFAGALVGVGESLLVVGTSGGGSDEYWLFLFGVLVYGALGAALGLGSALLWRIVRGGRANESLPAVAAAVGVAIPGLIVGRYHVAKRIFAEQLVLASAGGLVAHLLLLAGGVVAAVLCVTLVRALRRVLGEVAPALGLLGLAGAAFVTGLLTEKGEAVVVRGQAPAGVAAKPNIVLVVADTLRADAVDWSGGARGPASGFAALAADGTIFERAFAQSSWTRPSVASILTGVYPSVHGAVQKMDFLPDRVLTLAEALREQGYWTAAFTTNINVTPVFNFDQGFDEFHYLEPSFYFGASDSATALAAYKGLRVLRERVAGSRMYFQHYYQDAHVVNERVRAWLAENPPEPFFLFIHYMDPHDPYFEIPYNGRGVARVMTPSPDPADAGRLRELYGQDVAYLDEHLAALIAELRQTGVYDRSVVALTADHGEEFYEHEGWWHGTSLYDEVLHVPLVFKKVRSDRTAGGGQATEALGGDRRRDLARTIDIAPTLMAAAGLPVPSSFLGIDLFTGQVTEPLMAEEDLEGNRLASLRSDGWKLILANPGNPRGLPPTALFDLEADPGEERNLAASEAERTNELAEHLEEMRRRIAARSNTAETARRYVVDRGT